MTDELPLYLIEAARSSRSRCKTCRRKIERGHVRLGTRIEGPYGTGYLWHHLRCAARRRFDDVEQAYEREAWKEAKEPPGKLPSLDELRRHAAEAEERRERRRQPPWAELDPSGRARCRHCGEIIERGSVRIVLGRKVEFGNQVRTGTMHVHPPCAGPAMTADDCATTPEELAATLRDNSPELAPERLAAALAEVSSQA